MNSSDLETALVGLQQAAAIAGVSLSTVRRWADEGRLPSTRTAGGHRRFRVADVRRASTIAPPSAEGTQIFGTLAISRIRRQMGQPRTSQFEWLAGLDDSARDRLRVLGRHLLSTMEEYLGRRRARAAVMAEGRQFGLLYGRELAQAGLTVRQAIEAFTFFRRSLEEAARRFAVQQGLSPPEHDDVRDQLDALNDRVLLGVAEAYE